MWTSTGCRREACNGPRYGHPRQYVEAAVRAGLLASVQGRRILGPRSDRDGYPDSREKFTSS